MHPLRRTENLGVQLSYRRYGRWMFWRPWLVLIQGVGFDADGWDPVLPRLRRSFRLVVPENRGVGPETDSPSGWYTVATMASDVVAVLDAERIPAAHVLGVSLGGMVAQELAISHRERVGRLVLVSTTSGWPLTYPLPAASRRLLAVSPALSQEHRLRRQVTNMMSQQSIRERPRLVGRMSSYLRSRKHPPRSTRQQMAAGATYIGGLRQHQIQATTLVLHGSEDTIAHPGNARLLTAQIPGATRVMFPGAGHLLAWEHPDRFCHVVTAFLRRRVTNTDIGAEPSPARSRLRSTRPAPTPPSPEAYGRRQQPRRSAAN